MTLALVTPPAAEPLSVAEAKEHIGIDHSAADALIARMIAAARIECEHLLHRSLITQTWEQWLDAFPSVELALGMPPVQSVTWVKYADTAGATQTMDAADYWLDSVNDPHFVIPAAGKSWPGTYPTANAVRVRFVAGFGAAGSAVPADILCWLLEQVGTLFRFREQFVTGTIVTALPNNFTDRIMDRWWVPV